MSKNIGFVSTRFAGQDGVSLESAKWAEVLWQDRHVSFWYSGQSDRNPDISHVVPEAFFGFSENQWINERIWKGDVRDRFVTERIRALSDYKTVSTALWRSLISIFLFPKIVWRFPCTFPLVLP